MEIKSKMFRYKLLPVIACLCCISANSQALVKTHHYAYKETDLENCSAVDMELNYPFFYSPSGNPLAMINDSISKLIGDFDFYSGATVSSFLEKSGDTTIVRNDTAKGINCDQLSLFPETSYLSYTIFINDNQLLSFSIEYSYHAGSGGHGAMSSTWSFCYDLKEGKWIDFNALFADKFNVSLLAKTDSMYLRETGIEAFDESYYFTGDVTIKRGYLAFTYTDRLGATYFYREINIPYADYEKHLLPRYRKLLKPGAEH